MGVATPRLQRRDAGSFAWTALGLTRGKAAESSIIIRWRGTVHDAIADVTLMCGGWLSVPLDRDTWHMRILASSLWWRHVAQRKIAWSAHVSKIRRTLASQAIQILTRGRRHTLAGSVHAGRRDAQGFSVATPKLRKCPFCLILSNFVHFALKLSPMLPKFYLSAK